MNLKETPLDDLLKQALVLAAEHSAELVDLLERIVDSAEFGEEIITLDLEVMDEVRNFLYGFKSLQSETSNYLH